MAVVDILPNSIAQIKRGGTWHKGMWWIPLYCANCHIEGGLVPEESMNHAFWLCNPCWETYGTIAGTMVTPDEAFWNKLAENDGHSKLNYGG